MFAMYLLEGQRNERFYGLQYLHMIRRAGLELHCCMALILRYMITRRKSTPRVGVAETTPAHSKLFGSPRKEPARHWSSVISLPDLALALQPHFEISFGLLISITSVHKILWQLDYQR